jgi:catechol-2,3-dioxygenase
MTWAQIRGAIPTSQRRDPYLDKLEGKIPEDFWERKMSDWRMEEQQVKMAIQGLINA